MSVNNIAEYCCKIAKRVSAAILLLVQRVRQETCARLPARLLLQDRVQEKCFLV